MRKVSFVIFLCALFAVAATAQSAAPTAAGGPSPAPVAAPKRGPVFRATKAQIKDVQAMLSTKKLYTGEATGKLDDLTRTSIKVFQKDNGLKETGTLNRATLEKMGIELTDGQKAIPASPNSYSTGDTDKSEAKSSIVDAKSVETKPKRTIFRATKDQVMEAQTMLKTKGMYDGEATGKLDDTTREGLKKFQTANGVKVTGTLNQATLEKMGIELTDKQKGAGTNK